MFQSPRGLLALLASVIVLTGQAAATGVRPPLAGWDVEQDVEMPSYAVAEPASTDLDIDSVVLSCEQGPDRRGLQLRLYLSRPGPLASRTAGTPKDDPTVELAIDGRAHRAQLLFADDFVVVADSADGALPLLSDGLLDALQAGRRLELRFDLLQEKPGQPLSFDGIAAVDLQSGRGGSAVAAVRRCAADTERQLVEAVRR